MIKNSNLGIATFVQMNETEETYTIENDNNFFGILENAVPQ
ncbi:hypothetical protein [Lysinibacillus sp. NPDC059133]